MNEVAASSDVVARMIANRAIAADDVAKLRRQVFADGVCDRAEAETVFELHRVCAEKDPEWAQFFVDSLTDHLVWKVEPKKYVSADNARFLIDNITRDGRVIGTAEMQLLVNVVHWSISCPEELAVLALEAVRQSILNPETAAYGSNRPPAVISAADVEVIRRVIYAPGSPGGFTVTRQEADLIFDLNNATVDSEYHDTWPDLFAKAIANHLMFPRGAADVPTAEEELRRERWLEERRGAGSFLLDMGGAVKSRDISFSEAWDTLDWGGKIRSREAQAREAAQSREAMARETIDDSEAKWLLGRIAADGRLHETEKALFAFIKENSPDIHPTVIQIIEEAGV